MEQQITLDADGRHASGRSFQNLADEYIEFAGALRTEWGEESPLPYLEFSEPYSWLRRSLLERCDQLGRTLRDTGDGQVTMADRNATTEQANVVSAVRSGRVE
jgi:hypothetical protein